MKIVWDEIKREANLQKHGLDFQALDDGFFEASIVRPVKFGRYSAIGRLDSGLITVIFFRLGSEGLSVISMRPASAKERKGLE
jgi:uncharacterized DUF497 family protein